jgi:hypothetical protein
MATWHTPFVSTGPRRALRLAGALALAWLLAPGALRAAPDEGSWRARYAHGKALLVQGHPDQAARVFEALADDPPSDADGRLARELASLARQTAAAHPKANGPHLRTSDELSVLYTSAFVYGLGTGGWVVLLTRSSNLAAAALPFIGFTTVAVGGVAVVDGYRPLRRGVPHSIAAGLYLGLGEGAWVIGLEHAGATRRGDDSRWSAEAVGTAMWAGATAGGIVGGLIGAWREPTPGRVSFTTSTGTWFGVLSGFAAAALEPRERSRGESAFLAGGIGYNLGIIGGVAVAPLIAPSVARVRFADLGAIGGGLLGAGIYTIAAERNATARGGLGSAALGAGVGLGLTWWLTAGMPRDPADAATRASALRPLVVPTSGGFIGGLSGEL